MTEPSPLVIAGGGPVGLYAALACAAHDIPFLLYAGEDAGRDRPIALSQGSRFLLERVGAFKPLTTTTIQSIHVSQRGRFGRTLITAEDEGVPALGHVVSYVELCRVLRERLGSRLQAGRVQHYALAPQGDAVAIESRDAQGQMVSHTTPLLVLAEGGGPQRAATPRRDALLRREGTRRRTFDAALTAGREYGQSAVVCEVRTELPHGHRAWERFTPEGPLALLPTGDALALVWSTNHETAHALCALREPAFLARLATHFGGRLGRFLSASARSAFPVSLAYRRELAMPRVLAIGNAAQTLHPVAGQGLNLGFRDAYALAETLQAPGSREDPGAAPVLQRYLDARLLDRRGGIAFTDALVRIFSNDIGALGVMRGAGLTALDCLPPLRHFVARRMMFGANGF